MSFVQALPKVKGQFSYEDEGATPKTRPSNIDRFLILESCDFPLPKRDAEAIYAPGGGRGPISVTTKKNWTLEGSFSYKVVTGEFLGAAFGKCVSTGSSPYTHNIAKDMLPYFAVAYGIDATSDVIYELLGCKVDQSVLKVSEDSNILLNDIDFKACIIQKGSTLESLTPQTTIPYVFKEGVFSSTSFYSGSKARIFDFELTLKNNLKIIKAPGSYTPYDLVEGYQEYELKLVVGAEDDTEITEIIDDTDKLYDYQILITRGANDTFKLSGDCKLKDPSLNVDENDIRHELVFLPKSAALEVVDSIETYPFE